MAQDAPFIAVGALRSHRALSRPRPALFWKVYLAFDEGEYRHENDEPEADPVQTYTHPMVAEIVSEYADIQIK